MNDRVKFRVDYPSGHIEVNAGIFFGTADDKRQKKFLKLARQHSSDNDRLWLLDTLRREKKMRKDILDAIEEMERKRCILLSQVSDLPLAKREPAGPEKALARQITKIEKVMELLENERWS